MLQYLRLSLLIFLVLPSACFSVKNRRGKSNQAPTPRPTSEEIGCVTALAREILRAFRDKGEECAQRNSASQQETNTEANTEESNDYNEDFRTTESKEDEVSLLVWDKFDGVEKIINGENVDTEKLESPGKGGSLILLGHDLGQTGDGHRMRGLFKKLREKSPKSTIVSIDWSTLSCKGFPKNPSKMRLKHLKNWCINPSKMRKAVGNTKNLLMKALTSNMTKTNIMPALMGASTLFATGIAGAAVHHSQEGQTQEEGFDPEQNSGSDYEESAMRMAKNQPKRLIFTFIDPPPIMSDENSKGFRGFEAFGKSIVNELKKITANKSFVGVMHSSDLHGDPEHQYGNVDVYANGGRLQNGCYQDKNNISQLGDALKCSSDRALGLFKNSLTTKYVSRACPCWNEFTKGKCSDKLKNYLGKTDRLRQDSYKYFVRTTKTGESKGDTSSLVGDRDDFNYEFDKTCENAKTPPREADSSSSNLGATITLLTLSFTATTCFVIKN